MYFHGVMSQLIIPCNSNLQYDAPAQQLSAALDNNVKHLLNFAPWEAFPYKPDAAVSALHNGQCIFLKFHITEEALRAAAGNINGNVWEDSCVEFFIAFDDAGYYNIEMNCIGTMLVGFGKDKDDRVLLPAEKIKRIRYAISIENYTGGLIHWQLAAAIPVELFSLHNITSLSGKKCRGNFYKCGDNLPRPHFLAWNNIESEQPNFHLSPFFGDLLFD